MKKLILAALMMTTMICSHLFAFTRAQLSSPTGYWLTIDDKTHKPRAVVQIYRVKTKKGVQLQGKTIVPLYIAGTSWRRKCTGCIAPWTNKTIKGMNIMYGYQQSGQYWDSPWINGSIFDVGSSKDVYRSKLWLIDGGKKLKLRGYLFVFYRTQTWQRLKNSQVTYYKKLYQKQVRQHPLA